MTMPLLKIQTNAAIDDQKSQLLLKSVSQRIAEALNKPEQYMMVSLEAGRPMMFAGTSEPTAFVELKAIGLPAAKTGELARLLCEVVGSELGVAKQRIYINFADVPANLWGWNGVTF
jgi:phenylpyruvate tautomerase